MFHIAEASASGQDEGQIHVNAVQQPGATQAAVHGALWNQMLVTSGGMTETATVGGQDSADGADSILAGRRWSLTGAGCTCAGPSAGCRACIRYRVTKFAGGSSGSKGHPRTFS